MLKRRFKISKVSHLITQMSEQISFHERVFLLTENTFLKDSKIVPMVPCDISYRIWRSYFGNFTYCCSRLHIYDPIRLLWKKTA